MSKAEGEDKQLAEWVAEVKRQTEIYKFPYAGNSSSYERLSDESVPAQSAVRLAAGIGYPGAPILQKVGMFFAQVFTYITSAALLKGKDPDPAVNNKRMWDVVKEALKVSSIATAFAEILAYFGADHLLTAFVEYLTGPCRSGALHTHFLNMTCAAFRQSCEALSFGAMNGIFTVLLQGFADYCSKKEIQMPDLAFQGFVLFVSSAVTYTCCTPAVTFLVNTTLTQMLAFLRVRAKFCNESLAYHTLASLGGVIVELPLAIFSYFIPTSGKCSYMYDVEAVDPKQHIPIEMECPVCFRLMYDVARLQGQCACRGCLVSQLQVTGRALNGALSSKEDILPASEVESVVRAFALSRGIKVVRIEEKAQEIM